MPFTAEQIEDIAASSLDWFLGQNGPWMQHVQEKPLLRAMDRAKKQFPGGRGDIRGNVLGDRSVTWQGFQGEDEVSYNNPALTRQFNYPWKEMHGGITVSNTELKHAGISVVDTARGENTVTHDAREQFLITDLFETKLAVMTEDLAHDRNQIFWQDGTADPKKPQGILAFLTETPSSGVTGGIDRSTNTWWRHRALTGANTIAASTSLQTLTKTLRKEVRQLHRYGGKPNLILCGSTAIEALEAEVHEKGTYTESGFTNAGQTDIGMADIRMKGVGSFMYDPTLDDLGLEDQIFMIDTRHLYPMVMTGEDMKRHNPARPAEKYVLYRAVTWTGQLICRKLNAHGRYQVTAP